MQKRKLLLTTLVTMTLLSVSIFYSCKKDDDNNDDNKDVLGYIYTSTNSSDGNGIVVLGRKEDGSLEETDNSPYPTGSVGDAADGDFDTQYALNIVGDFLLAMNAGPNPVNSSISVFRIDRTNGALTRIDQDPSTQTIDNIDSRGVRSVSIAAHETGGITWVVVANQYSNPNYQGNPPEDFGMIESSALRNLAVFTFDKSTGLLSYNSIGVTYNDGTNGGPAAVQFNAAGTKLAVSTWGVAHFAVDDPDLALQNPGRLYIYDFSGGTLNETGNFEEEGISGNIGISWSPNDQHVYMANFNLHSSKEDNSVTVHDGNTAAKIQNFATGDRNDEACWTLISTDNQHLYTASFTSNIVSVFDIGADGLLIKTINPNYFLRGGGIPPTDTKDMYQTPDGYLYVSGAFHTHSISIFQAGSDGGLTETSASPYSVPTSAWMISGQQAYLGLTGFEK